MTNASDTASSTAQRSQPLWLNSFPFLVTASLAMVAAGLISAVTASTPSHDAAWAVAYLVLVVGVAQAGFGLGQAWLTVCRPARLLIGAQWATYNLGNAGVILGTLNDRVWLVDLGGALLVAALVMFFATSLPLQSKGAWSEPRWLLTAYRGLILIILISIPVGLLLARR